MKPSSAFDTMTQALQQDFNDVAVEQFVKVARERADKTYVSTLFTLIDNEKIYGPKTKQRAFAQALNTIISFGKKHNGALVQSIFESIRENITIPEEYDAYGDHEGLNAVINYFTSRADDLCIDKQYETYYCARFGHTVALKKY